MRRARLPQVVNNSRFLIFPWTRIPHLASHVLAQAARQLGISRATLYRVLERSVLVTSGDLMDHAA